MNRLIIVCEGETEQEFCKDVLASYFREKNIYIEYPTIKHSNGGIVPWATLKRQLIFSDISVFKNNFTSDELQFSELEEAVKSADTPEEINNGPATAPSVRLMKAIAGYNKVVYGACLASEIGLTSIRSKCKLFDEWITLCLL